MKNKMSKILFFTFIGIMALSLNAHGNILIYDRLEKGSGDDPNLGLNTINALADGSVNLSFTDQFDANFTGTSLYALSGSGQNRLTVIWEYQEIASVIPNSSTGGTASSYLAQVGLNPVPNDSGARLSEPASMVFLGAGLAGLGCIGRRRKK